MNPILIGYRCCGKSTTGKYLSKLTGFSFVDTDQFIESRFKARIQDLVDKNGWDWFRKMESEALKETVIRPDTVVATGGGMVLAQENREFMRRHGLVIWLTADPETIVSRLNADTMNQASRPRFTNGSLLAETEDILNIRMPLYKKAASFSIDTTCHTPEQAAKIIQKEMTHVRI